MAIIRQHDKRSGITYAYESHSYWDKEKKMTRAKRTLIGRIDADTGEIVPTDGRGKKGKAGTKADAAGEPDYKKLYGALQKKYAAMETLNEALRRENKGLKEKAARVQ
jgi:hypothetical protein